MTKNKIDNFIKELAALTIKYGIEIGGCGCCGSPWLNDIGTPIDWESKYLNKKEIGNNLTFYGGKKMYIYQHVEGWEGKVYENY